MAIAALSTTVPSRRSLFAAIGALAAAPVLPVIAVGGHPAAAFEHAASEYARLIEAGSEASRVATARGANIWDADEAAYHFDLQAEEHAEFLRSAVPSCARGALLKLQHARDNTAMPCDEAWIAIASVMTWLERA